MPTLSCDTLLRYLQERNAKDALSGRIVYPAFRPKSMVDLDSSPLYILAAVRKYADGLLNALMDEIDAEMRQFFSNIDFASMSQTNMENITRVLLAKTSAEATTIVSSVRKLTKVHDWKINMFESFLYEKYESDLEDERICGVATVDDLSTFDLSWDNLKQFQAKMSTHPTRQNATLYARINTALRGNIMFNEIKLKWQTISSTSFGVP